MKWVRIPPRDGDQLRLALFTDEPWDGQSPRALTRVGLGFILKAEAAPPRGPFHDPEQLELWPVDKPHRERGPVYDGAPLLLEPYTP